MSIRIGLFVTFSLLVSACATTSANALPFVDFTQREQVSHADNGPVKSLRIAVAAILSPEGNVESYSGLASYLSSKMNRPVTIVQRRTYQEINDLLQAGDVDVGFVCTSAYVLGHDLFGLRLLAAPQIGNQTVYYAEIIVPADSTATSMEDLGGVTFAFTDPISTTGRIYPTYLVMQLGETPDSFFGGTIFTYSHDRAIEAVADGVAGAASVDSLVLDYALDRDPTLASKIKVIQRSPAFAIPPVVVAPGVTPRQAAEIQGYLLGISTDPVGAPVLAALGIDGFVSIDDSAYDGVRVVIDSVNRSG